MDDVEVLKNVLVNTIARLSKSVQSYETEIANMAAEIFRLQSEVANLKTKK
jgi:hypothetical protein